MAKLLLWLVVIPIAKVTGIESTVIIIISICYNWYNPPGVGKYGLARLLHISVYS